MFSICRKELSRIFSSLSGYIAIILFLLICGLFLFVLPDSNIPESGYATLDNFFDLAPWVLLFLVPALAMNGFPEEFRRGTFELLKTKPVSSGGIAGGKYLALLAVLFFILIPTVTYAITIKALSVQNEIDTGSIIGSYLGLFLLAACYAAICLCCGAFTKNAVAAFLSGGFICLVLWYGFNALSKLPAFSGSADYYIENLGMDYHYKSISRGVIDSRDLVYFFSLIALSMLIAVARLNKKQA